MAIEGRLGLVGGGNMGSALLSGLLANGVARPGQVVLIEKDAAKAQALAQRLGVESQTDISRMGRVDVCILAVKPADAPACAKAVGAQLGDGGVVISLAAGVASQTVAAALPTGLAVVRAMPNTPALIGRGVTAICAGQGADDQVMDLAAQIFGAAGQVVVVAEKLMDAVTGLSGSGPAYVYLIIEALADAGVLLGLDRPTALTLATATVAGAAEMVGQSGKHPAVLKDQVTSPGGTTISGLAVLERAGLRGLLMDAVAAAARRSRELSGN